MKTTLFLLASFISLHLSAQNIQWRNDRTGVYHETGLTKTWPAEGPAMLWHYTGLGEGYSSVAVANDKIYVTGLTDGKGHLFVFDLAGKLLGKAVYGDEWAVNYNGARATVTADEGKLYIYSGTGNLVCMDEKTFNILWQKNIVGDFEGSNVRWGVNESPLIVGDKAVITPGGKTNNVVALNKHTGELIWSCAGEGDLPAYCSPLYIADLPVPQIVTITEKHILGIDAQNGQKLWSFPYGNFRNIHPNTPLYADNMLLCVSGYGKGSVMLRLTDGGRSVEKVWENSEFDSRIGGAVKVGDHVYGSGESSRYWFCLDWKTGATRRKEKGLPPSNIIANDGMLYCYTEQGDMILAKAAPEKFDIAGKFRITQGTAQHWAHPVICKGVLYVRHGDTLMAYNIK